MNFSVGILIKLVLLHGTSSPKEGLLQSEAVKLNARERAKNYFSSLPEFYNRNQVHTEPISGGIMCLWKVLSAWGAGLHFPGQSSLWQEPASCNRAAVAPAPRLELLRDTFLGLALFGPDLFIHMRKGITPETSASACLCTTRKTACYQSHGEQICLSWESST